MRKRKSTQINQIKYGYGEITLDITYIFKIMEKYYKQTYSNTFENLDKMNFQKNTRGKIKIPRKLIAVKLTKMVNKTLFNLNQINKIQQVPDVGFTNKVYQTFKELKGPMQT